MVSETLVARGVAGGQAASTGTWPFGRQHTIGDDDQGLAIVYRDGRRHDAARHAGRDVVRVARCLPVGGHVSGQHEHAG